jgi:hypothetical protein
MKPLLSRAITVSVVIPTIGRQSVVRSIDSVTSQIGGVLSEIIVCFDNTSNNIIPDRDYTANGVNIRVVHNCGKKGVASTLNRAIKDATGTLVAWLSDDDYFSSPIRLLRVVNFINHNGMADQRDSLLLFGDMYVYSDFLPENLSDISRAFNPQLMHVGAHVKRFDSHYEYGHSCISKGLINGCATVFSKALWTLVGGFPVHQGLQTTQDIVFWMSIIEKSAIIRYVEGAYSTSVQHALQGQQTMREIMATEVEQLKTVVHLKHLRDFQLKRFTLKDYFNFFYHCMLLSVTPVSIFSHSNDSPIRQLSEFEFQQNTIAVLCFAHSMPVEMDFVSVWRSCVSGFFGTLGGGQYCKNFLVDALHVYIDVNGLVFRLNVLDTIQSVELSASPEYTASGDILLDYRYVITANFSELAAGSSTLKHHFQALLLREDLCEFWTYLDQRNLELLRVNQLIVRAPWSFTAKP